MISRTWKGVLVGKIDVPSHNLEKEKRYERRGIPFLYSTTGWSEKKPAKLSEFSLNFPKLADWLCMGWSVCQAAAKEGNSNRGKSFLHQPV